MVYRSQDLGARYAHFNWIAIACRLSQWTEGGNRFSPNSKSIGSILQKYHIDMHLIIANILMHDSIKEMYGIQRWVISSTQYSPKKVTVNGGPKEVKELLQLCCRCLSSRSKEVQELDKEYLFQTWFPTMSSRSKTLPP